MPSLPSYYRPTAENFRWSVRTEVVRVLKSFYHLLPIPVRPRDTTGSSHAFVVAENGGYALSPVVRGYVFQEARFAAEIPASGETRTQKSTSRIACINQTRIYVKSRNGLRYFLFLQEFVAKIQTHS